MEGHRGHKLENPISALDGSGETPEITRDDRPIDTARRRQLGEVNLLRLRFALFGMLLVLMAYFATQLPGLRSWWILPGLPALLVVAAILAANTGARTRRLATVAVALLLTLTIANDVLGWLVGL